MKNWRITTPDLKGFTTVSVGFPTCCKLLSYRWLFSQNEGANFWFYYSYLPHLSREWHEKHSQMVREDTKNAANFGRSFRV